VPWTALVVGLWIPNFYYWGLNQYICQRALGSKSLSQGQKGVVFAAALKLIIPFIIVVPGLMAFNLFSADMADEALKDQEILANNEKVLTLYEELEQGDSEGRFVAFRFDKGWEERHPDRAAELRTHNARVEADARTAGKKLEEENLLGYKYDTAFALLIGKLIPFGVGLQGFMLAAILGAVVSSLASMLNAASTIFTMDLYRKYMHKKASQATLVRVGRICVGVFVVLGCLIAPLLDNPDFGGIFKYIQEFQGFISPGILAVFVFGLLVKRAPPLCGVIGLLLNPPMYGLLKLLLPGLAFLDRMAVSFFCVLLVMGVITSLRPLEKAAELPRKTDLDLESSSLAKVSGALVIVATLVLYAIFW
jgi:SSS family solute:Na+ symporter